MKLSPLTLNSHKMLTQKFSQLIFQLISKFFPPALFTLFIIFKCTVFLSVFDVSAASVTVRIVKSTAALNRPFTVLLVHHLLYKVVATRAIFYSHQQLGISKTVLRQKSKALAFAARCPQYVQHVGKSSIRLLGNKTALEARDVCQFVLFSIENET